jgi:hypothetical protein
MHTATSAMPNAIHGTATIMSAPVIRHLSSSQGKPPRLQDECARCGGQMEMTPADAVAAGAWAAAAAGAAGGRARSGAAVLHTVSIEAAWRLQKVRVR